MKRNLFNLYDEIVLGIQSFDIYTLSSETDLLFIGLSNEYV